MPIDAKCALCGAGLPIARSMLGKAITPVVLNALDLREGRSPLDKVVTSLVGLGVGHLIDMALASLLGSTCSQCQAAKRSA